MDSEEAIDSLLAQTALLSCDEPTITLSRQPGRAAEAASKSLFGRFISNRPCFVSPLKNNAQRVWKLNGDVRVKSLNKNLFLFSFYDPEDKERVGKESPWHIMQSHLVMRGWEDYRTPEKVLIDATMAWIRVFGLSPELQSLENIEQIAGLFKFFEEVDLDTGHD
ncbi:hypothetical protein LINPERHAP1_LOCUS243 [Linum perenne]